MELIILGLIIGIIWWLVKSSKTKSAEDTTARWQELHDRFLNEIQKSVSMKPLRMNVDYAKEAGAVINSNEDLLIHCPGVLIRSVKTGSGWKSGSRGVRVSPVKGFSFSLGGSRGKMQNFHETQTDEGFYALTTKRLIFTGNKYSFALPSGKIQNVIRDGSQVFIDAAARDVPDFYAQFFTSASAELFTDMLSNASNGVDS